MLTRPDSADTSLEQLADILLHAGQCDARALERARRVADETNQRLDQVLLQLGLISERGMAEAYSTLLGLPIAGVDRYPPAQPMLPDRLTARFVRHARSPPTRLDGGPWVGGAGDQLAPPRERLRVLPGGGGDHVDVEDQHRCWSGPTWVWRAAWTARLDRRSMPGRAPVPPPNTGTAG